MGKERLGNERIQHSIVCTREEETKEKMVQGNECVGSVRGKEGRGLWKGEM